MGLSGELVGVIVGACLAGIIGIVTVYAAKLLEEKRTKKNLSRALLSEVQINQNRLHPLAYLIPILEEDTDRFFFFEFPNEIHFDRTLYSSLSDKIGLLDSRSSEKVVQYYANTKFAEEQYKKLKSIHGSNLSVLKNARERAEWANPLDPIYLGEDSSSRIELAEIEKLLRNAGEAYSIGEELIKSLKEQI